MITKNAKNYTDKSSTEEEISILPEDVVKYNHWKEGQAIEMKLKDGKIYLTALPEQDVA